MKSWVKNKKGEALIEIVISLLVLSILMVAVSTIIQASLRITAAAAQNARITQEEVINPLILANYGDASGTADITLTVEISVWDDGLIIPGWIETPDLHKKVNSRISYNKEGLIAFVPIPVHDWGIKK